MRLIILTAAWLLVGGLDDARAETLLTPSQGQRPNDSNGNVRISLVDETGFEGGCLKVDFVDAGSIGQSRPPIIDWRSHNSLDFDVANRQTSPIVLSLTIKHKGSSDFATRVDRSLTIKPGKQRISVALKALKNNNGSIPDLSAVRHWYISCSQKRATIYLGDFVLVGDDRPRQPQRATTTASGPAARVGHALPVISEPILFNTPAADAVMNALQLFPADNPWHEDISKRPRHANSKRLIASTQSRRHLYFNWDMGFIIVPANQKRVAVTITDYPGESDPGPFPVPDNAPIEGWPVGGGTLAEIQRAKGGDRHMLILDPYNGQLHEFFVARFTKKGWQAAQVSTFNIRSNQLRPDGWTSADAAGLPILPAVVHYAELERGVIDHAMRVTIRKTRRAYVYPATHFASRDSDPNLLRMGDRLRLRQGYDISGFPPHAQTVLTALKTYGMIVADNGIDWCISVTPDKRIKGLDTLTRVKGYDFEVIVPTGPREGTRARQGK